MHSTDLHPLPGLWTPRRGVPSYPCGSKSDPTGSERREPLRFVALKGLAQGWRSTLTGLIITPSDAMAFVTDATMPGTSVGPSMVIAV